jgi:hypothetical protein
VNVIFLSPNFPPQFRHFCRALRERSATSLAIGDAPFGELDPELKASLTEYFYLPSLERYDELLRAVAYLTWRHGHIDRIDSLNEHWLPLEARLREDFNIPGLRPQALSTYRSKMGMARIFDAAGIPHPGGQRVESAEQVRGFAREVGFPLIFKPDVGVGAGGAFRVSDEQALQEALKRPLPGYVVQRLVPGRITTYDGLTDAEGRIIFDCSLVYGSGVMEVVTEGLDLFYYTRREIPAPLEELGRRVVKAFDIRERFFHIEFFELPGGLCALEINLRAPGGFTTDIMGYSYDIDVYSLWAAVITGASLEGFSYSRKYHCAHVGRREQRAYRHSHDEIVATLGPMLLSYRRLSPPISHAMGEHVYLVRDPSEQRLLDTVRWMQEWG